MDFHLEDILERVTTGHLEIQPSLVNKQNRTFLKFVKWKDEETGIVSFNPLVFVLVYKINLNSIKILLISYNEEILEDLETQVEMHNPIDESLISHILFNLSRRYSPCMGVSDNDLEEIDLAKILVEKFGEKIYVRSKKCSRVMFDEKSICSECEQLAETLEPLENLELDSQPDLEAVNTEDIDTKEEIASTPSGRNKKFQCNAEFCGIILSKESDLVVHLYQSHPGLQHPLLDRYLKCPQEGCTRVFSRGKGSGLEGHLKRCSTVSPSLQPSSIQCQVCFKTFKSQYLLKKHITGVHDAPTVSCQMCGAGIKGEKSLRTHLKLVHGDTRFYCPEPGCTVTAKNKDHIKDHVAAIHLNEPRYICSTCGARFKYRNKWKYCEDKHRGRFLHACTHCSKQFNDKRKCEVHMRTHTGEKPYSCPICKFKMARLDNLNAHTKKTHGLTWREAEKLSRESAMDGGVELGGSDFLLAETAECIELKQTEVAFLECL